MLEYAPEVMQDLLGPLERDEADLVMGSRMLIRGGALRGHMPLYKFVGNRILTTYENLLAGTRFSEWHSGYRAYATDALRAIDIDALTWSWHFDTQVILALLDAGKRIVEVPIAFTDRVRGASKMSLAVMTEEMALVSLWGLRDRVRGHR